MRCADFQELYSDYRDGRLQDRARLTEVERHLRECPRCARQDLAVRRGVEVLRAGPSLEPSPAFRRALQRRLAFSRAGTDPGLAPGGLVASLLVAAAVGLVLIEGVTRLQQTQPAAERSPQVVANPGPPFVGFARADPAAAITPDTTDDEDTALHVPAVAP